MLGTNKTEGQLRAEGFVPLPRWKSGAFHHNVLHEKVQHLVELGVPLFVQTHHRTTPAKLDVVWVPSWAPQLVNEVWPENGLRGVIISDTWVDLKELARRAVQDAYGNENSDARAQELLSTFLLGGAIALDGAINAGSIAVSVVTPTSGYPKTVRRPRNRSQKRKRLLGE